MSNFLSNIAGIKSAQVFLFLTVHVSKACFDVFALITNARDSWVPSKKHGINYSVTRIKLTILNDWKYIIFLRMLWKLIRRYLDRSF